MAKEYRQPGPCPVGDIAEPVERSFGPQGPDQGWKEGDVSLYASQCNATASSFCTLPVLCA